MLQLLCDLGADVHRAASNGERTIHVAARNRYDKTVLLLLSLRASIDVQNNDGRTPCWTASFDGHPKVIRLLIMHRASVDLLNKNQSTPLRIAAQENKPECIAILAAAKASLEGAMADSPIGMAAQKGADESVRLLAYLGARLMQPEDEIYAATPFWDNFKDKKGRVRDPALWERILAEGGDEGTPESLQKRIRILKEAKVHDPRDGASW